MGRTVTEPRKLAEALASIRGWVIDMDGVLYRGQTALPHVQQFLTTLDTHDLPYILATNNSMQTPRQYVEKLARMGVSVRPERILTSALATAVWLKPRFPRGTPAYVVGMPALEEAIYGDGYFVPATAEARVVVSGLDLTLTYDKLKIADLALRGGAAYVATNADRTLPTEEGLLPGSGSIVAALTAASDVEPTVIGKPSTGMLEASLTELGLPASAAAMLGDRLDTDILGGNRAGMLTVMVLTGVNTLADLVASEIVPDVVVPDLAPLVTFYEGIR
ncbi:MAG TPA: HAD-IIA family hydrolase [Thermomicrobiaceae bacterium]|nr:HAD-IIA family hydrolase [Thermomicrobiaceae bacterium]